MWKRSLGVVLVGVLAACSAATTNDDGEASTSGVTVVRDPDGRYIDVVESWSEMHDDAKTRAMSDAMSMFTEKLDAAGASRGVDVGSQSDSSQVLSQQEFSSLAQTMGERLKQNESNIAGYGISPADLVPTGFMVIVGLGGDVNLKIGAGTSASLAIVVVPRHVTRRWRTNNQVDSFWRYDLGVTGLGAVSAGSGVGGGASFRLGVGLLWGKLDSAQDFRGTLIGVSGTVSALGGAYMYGQVLKRDTSQVVNNVLVTASWKWGPQADVAAHLSLGLAIPLPELLRTLGFASPEVERPDTASQQPAVSPPVDGGK